MDSEKEKESQRQKVKYATSKAPQTIKDYFDKHKNDPDVGPKLVEALSLVKKADFSNVEAIIQAHESKTCRTVPLSVRWSVHLPKQWFTLHVHPHIFA